MTAEISCLWYRAADDDSEDDQLFLLFPPAQVRHQITPQRSTYFVVLFDRFETSKQTI